MSGSTLNTTRTQSEEVVAVNQADELRFTDDQFIWRFSPNQTDPRLLEAIFVGREELLQNVFEKVAESATTRSKHHVLLYGPRGIGKTHFTTLLNHRLTTDEKLGDKIRIARLNEDETTTSLVQLLVRIYRSLCGTYPDEFSAAWLDELLDQPPADIAEVLTRRLVARFEQRTLVILIENLNLLFENLGKSGQHDLRTLLQEHPFACLVATTQQLFKAVSNRTEPFFGFFQTLQLQRLTADEAQQLLVRIARFKGQEDLVTFLNSPDGRGRVRAIHDLAGGNHRVYIVLSGFITRESLDQLVVPFKKMADDLTPYYQERLRWISPQQRQIVELLCRQRGTLTPKEMARRLLVSENTVGSQVRKLVEIGYLTSTKRGRETFYELSEPLMRLAYEVKEQSLLVMLVDFLRVWYRPDQLKELRAGRLSPATCAYVDAAIERSQSHPDPRLQVLRAELQKAEAEGRSQLLASVWEEKAAVTGAATDWFNAGYHYDEVNQDYSKAIACYTMAIDVDPDYTFAWNNKGLLLNKLGHYEEALTCLDKALDIDPDDAYPWNNKGLALINLGRYEQALTCLDKALDIDPDYAHPWNNKGLAQNNLGRYEEAIKCLDKALDIDPDDAYAGNNKGLALNKLGRYEEALTCLDKVLGIDPNYAHVWNNKGNSLQGLGRNQAALTCYDKALELDSANLYPRFNRSEPLFSLERWNEGFGAIRSAFKHVDRGAVVLGDVKSMFSLIFQRSDDDAALRSRVATLINIYEEACAPESQASGDVAGARAIDPLAYLGDGLVKSLAQIDPERVTPQVLESYVEAVAARAAKIPQFDVPLRLFRYGIRYLITKGPDVFVELIQPERHILNELFGTPSEVGVLVLDDSNDQ